MDNVVAQGLSDIGEVVAFSRSENFRRVGEIMREVGFGMTEQTRAALPAWVREATKEALDCPPGLRGIARTEMHVVHLVRLTEVAAEMAESAEAAKVDLQERCMELREELQYGPIPSDGWCPKCTRPGCSVPGLMKALAKYRGEVDADER